MKRILTLFLILLLLLPTFALAKETVELERFSLVTRLWLEKEYGAPVKEEELKGPENITFLVYSIESRVIVLNYNDKVYAWKAPTAYSLSEMVTAMYNLLEEYEFSDGHFFCLSEKDFTEVMKNLTNK